MTNSQLEKKLKHLRKEIEYYTKIFPKSDKIKTLKSSYRHYRRFKSVKKEISFHYYI